MPSARDYATAIQNPQNSLLDPELRNARVQTDPLGLPWARCGGFAATFRLDDSNGSSWALRCFTSNVPDRGARYRAISSSLQHIDSWPFVPFEYQNQGILLHGERFPIVKMKWVHGNTLGHFLEEHHRNRHVIAQLSKQFQSAIAVLEEAGIAHGDLQHGNIMVDSAGSQLVDYDDMFVPGMTAKHSHTPGHRNYNSQLRTSTDFGPHIDRFGAIVITLALEALAKAPALWNTYAAGGENLLFTASDFFDPVHSPLFKDLGRMAELAPLVDGLKHLSRTPLEQIPSLSEFMAGSTAVATGDLVSLTGRRLDFQQFKVLAASDRVGLLDHQGAVLQVIGRVADVEYFSQSFGRYALVHFDDRKDGGFRLVLWPDSLDLYESSGRRLSELKSKWISATKLLELSGKGLYPLTPQMNIESPVEIHLLEGKHEADELLGGTHVNVDQDPFWRSKPATRSAARASSRIPGRNRHGFSSRPPRLQPSTAAPGLSRVLLNPRASSPTANQVILRLIQDGMQRALIRGLRSISAPGAGKRPGKSASSQGPRSITTSARGRRRMQRQAYGGVHTGCSRWAQYGCMMMFGMYLFICLFGYLFILPLLRLN